MITEHKTGNTTYTVRVFLKSRQNPALRITRQKKGFRTRLEAEREEARMKKECERELSQTEARGTLFCDLLDECTSSTKSLRVIAFGSLGFRRCAQPHSTKETRKPLSERETKCSRHLSCRRRGSRILWLRRI